MSTTFDGPARAIKPAGPQPPAEAAAPPEVATPAAAATTWGNSAPLALAAFAVPTFMLSAINIGWVNIAVTPMIFAVALMSGGIVQLIAGIIQLRTGNTFTGVLFSMYGALWLSLFAFAEFFESEIPPDRARSRPRAAAVRVRRLHLVGLRRLVPDQSRGGHGAGTPGGHPVPARGRQVRREHRPGHACGWLGFIAAAQAAYLSCAELCQAAYKREILPVWPLAK